MEQGTVLRRTGGMPSTLVSENHLSWALSMWLIAEGGGAGNLVTYHKFQSPLTCQQGALPFPYFSFQRSCHFSLLGSQELLLPYLKILTALFKNLNRKEEREKDRASWWCCITRTCLI